MADQTKNMLIGVFVIVACSLAVALVMFLRPATGNGKQTLYVRFADINNINMHTRVLFAGKPIGEVTAIEPIYDVRSQPTDLQGSVYVYQLTLKIDSSVKVYDTDEIGVQTSGLLGEKSIGIIPKAPPKGKIPKLIGCEPMYAESVDLIQNAFNEISEVAHDVQDTFRRMTHWIDDHGEMLACTIDHFGQVMTQLNVAISDFNRLELLQDIQHITRTTSHLVDQIDSALCTMQQKRVFQNIATSVYHIKNATSSLDSTLAQIARGSGTLGKLIHSDCLYLQVSSVLSKIGMLMNDINHYGMLFHLNKQWQRQHLQRVHLLDALHSSKNFKDYCEEELDQMQLSLSRLSMLIDKAANTPAQSTIMQSSNFQQSLSELQHQSESLSENLKLFSQQVMDNVEKCK
jgi:phospholipid/cholesterol/gamma-HCH transport system substrate-binding protein